MENGQVLLEDNEQTNVFVGPFAKLNVGKDQYHYGDHRYLDLPKLPF